jgi:hypothetical protein
MKNKINSNKSKLPEIELTHFMAGVIEIFCENLAELGCEKDAEPDMWYRYLSDKQKLKVMKKMVKIIEKNYK